MNDSKKTKVEIEDFACTNLVAKIAIQAQLDQIKEGHAKLQEQAGELTKKLAELKEAKEPDLKPGDYGIYKHKNDQVDIPSSIDCERLIRFSKKSPRGCDFAALPLHCGTFTKHGNYIEDLERNSVDLTRFKVEGSNYGDEFNLSPSEVNSDVFLLTHGGTCRFNREKLISIYQKMGQVIATLRRKQN